MMMMISKVFLPFHCHPHLTVQQHTVHFIRDSAQHRQQSETGALIHQVVSLQHPCQLPCCYPQGWSFPQRWYHGKQLLPCRGVMQESAARMLMLCLIHWSHAVTLGGSLTLSGKGPQTWPPFLLFLISGSEFKVNPCRWENAQLCSQPESPQELCMHPHSCTQWKKLHPYANPALLY